MTCDSKINICVYNIVILMCKIRIILLIPIYSLNVNFRLIDLLNGVNVNLRSISAI